jgi:aspartate aminotransferase-like enzyme
MQGTNTMRNAPPRPTAYRLRLPGPTAVPERAQQAIAQQLVNHRGPEAHALIAEVEARAKPIFGTANDILLFAGSGTAVMEASLANILAPGERVLVALNGQFGERFKAIAESMGAIVDGIEAEWGEAPDPAAIKRRLAEHDYRAVCVVHNESATGAVADLAAIGKIVKDRPALLVVDSVSGLGGIEVRQDDWHVDILLSASQKALMCPPGIGLVSVGAKAWAVVERADRVPRFFWDFRKAKAAIDKSETAFTPPLSLIGGLREALRMIDEEGLANVHARHRRLAAALRAGGAALGLDIFTAPSARRSDTVSVFRVPEGVEGGAIVRHLYEHHHTVIAGARNRLAGRVIRIGTMGALTEGDILTDLLHLEETLRTLGQRVAPGAGVTAAASVLAEPALSRP